MARQAGGLVRGGLLDDFRLTLFEIDFLQIF
jgi:hypothetical protein